MAKLIINDKSYLKKNIFAANFFINDKKIKIKSNMEEIENLDYGEYEVKVKYLFSRSSKHIINISKDITIINIENTMENVIVRGIFSIIYFAFIIVSIVKKDIKDLEMLIFLVGIVVARIFYKIVRKTLVIKVQEEKL